VMSSFLSPLDGYSDLAFRLLCQHHGAEAACVPLVHALSVVKGTASLDAHPDERDIGVQLAGNDPETIGRACSMIYDEKPFISWFDLNCGCPSPRTVDCGGGSALLPHAGRIARIVGEMRKRTDARVSAKIRVRNNLQDTVALCRDLEAAGADFITIHGRTVSQGYNGKADWELIRAVHEQLDIPVVGNGDIKSASQGRDYVRKGYCDSFMVGRAAMSNPLLFEDKAPETMEQRGALLGEYVSIHREYVGEPEANDVRLKALSLVTNARCATRIRNSICRAKKIKNIEQEFLKF